MRKIEIDQSPPTCEIGVLDRNVDITSADIVDENIDGRPLAERAAAKVLACCGFGNIGREDPGFATALAHLGGGSGKRVRIARDKHDIGASLCGCERNRSAESPAAPRDKDAFAVQPELVEHRHFRRSPRVRVAHSFSRWRLPAKH
jgi:hypothetical protein